MAVYKATKEKSARPEGSDGKVTARTAVTDEAMERLARLMNDTPTVVRLAGTEWEIKALRPGTQWLIAEEACKIVSKEGMTMGDVLKQFAVNMPSVCRVITLALLNDKERINGKEYDEVYERLMWGECDVRSWARLLSEVLGMIDLDFFFGCTNAVKTLRQSTLDRKTTAKERG